MSLLTPRRLASGGCTLVQPAYSSEAITACYMLRSIFHLSLRGTEGLVRLLFSRAGLDPSLAPDFSTLSKRRTSGHLRRPRRCGEVLLIDGTGFAFRTRGPWITHKWHGDKTARHRFVRVTLTTDASNGAVIDAVVTPDHGVGTGEVTQFPRLVSSGAQRGATTIIGDGAYDTGDCYRHARGSGVRLITPPHVNAVQGLDRDRDITLTQVDRLGTPRWKKRVGYHQRSRVESDIGALKAALTDTVRAHSFSGARAEVLAGISVVNLWRVGAEDLEVAG